VILACGIAIKQCMEMELRSFEDGSSLLGSLVLRDGLVFFGVLIKNDEPS